ncbi:MAG TPA: SMC family ATPase, partial [Pseudonocardiaceae bacterium]
MRALRLLLDGFGSYREAAEVDLTDVTFFVLTGPTGSGKSTVIDALCFALYGTVPRWGKGNVIRNALAPSTTECRVCLVFEAAGARYAAVRLLRRDARGNVHTKEARLDRLADDVPADADLVKLLETGASLAEGPDQVTAAVSELLGIGYEHFTQCVLLPQGQFAEFLHAKPADRQDLLIRLLAFSVYEQVGQQARERGKQAAVKLQLATDRLDALGPVSAGDVEALAARVAGLDALVPRVEAAVAAMAGLRERWTAA